jgi:hypothetical protein
VCVCVCVCVCVGRGGRACVHVKYGIVSTTISPNLFMHRPHHCVSSTPSLLHRSQPRGDGRQDARREARAHEGSSLSPQLCRARTHTQPQERQGWQRWPWQRARQSRVVLSCAYTFARSAAGGCRVVCATPGVQRCGTGIPRACDHDPAPRHGALRGGVVIRLHGTTGTPIGSRCVGAC